MGRILDAMVFGFFFLGVGIFGYFIFTGHLDILMMLPKKWMNRTLLFLISIGMVFVVTMIMVSMINSFLAQSRYEKEIQNPPL